MYQIIEVQFQQATGIIYIRQKTPRKITINVLMIITMVTTKCLPF